jgi:hypothetical protein
VHKANIVRKKQYMIDGDKAFIMFYPDTSKEYEEALISKINARDVSVDISQEEKDMLADKID